MDATSSTTLLAGLPAAWIPAFAKTLSSSGQSLAVLTDGDRRSLDGVRAIPVSEGWTDAAEVLARDAADHASVTAAIIVALHAPKVTTLMDALAALETAVVVNDLAPQQLLAALIQGLLPQQTGRILLITYDPRSITQPGDAAVRGSARGIFTYLESLRPALQKRGITAGMLLLSVAQSDRWDVSAHAERVASAAAECLRNGTLQRVIKMR